eukprot:1158331-Pelagomonas_calceolata.AAC.2
MCEMRAPANVDALSMHARCRRCATACGSALAYSTIEDPHTTLYADLQGARFMLILTNDAPCTGSARSECGEQRAPAQGLNHQGMIHAFRTFHEQPKPMWHAYKHSPGWCKLVMGGQAQSG